MATYKVIQDIEAEDKLLGPLTLRQFLYAIVVVVLGFIAFRLAILKWFLALPFLPPMALFAVLAAPFGHDQPSEVWLLAKIRFFLKPRRRIWDQSGVKELVTINVPKRPVKIYTDGLTQSEVRSRLHALANTIDSRGWAVKNVNVNLYGQPAYVASAASDRLVEPSSLPQEVPTIEIQASDDILDAQSNPVAHHLDEMIVASTQAHRQQVLANLSSATTPQNVGQNGTSGQAQTQDDYWFMQTPQPPSSDRNLTTFTQPQILAPGTTPTPPSVSAIDEQAALTQIHPDFNQPVVAYGHMKTIQPLSAQHAQPVTTHPSATTKGTQNAGASMTDQRRPDILELAKNDDFTVATIARQAKRNDPKQPHDGEVVVNLQH